MKKILLYIIPICFASCARDNCVDYLIANKTNNALDIVSFERDSISRNITILPHNNYTELSICEWGGNAITYSIYDSIQIRTKNVLRKTYYPDDEGKSIYKTEDQNYWKRVVNDKYYKKYVFEVTEDDLN